MKKAYIILFVSLFAISPSCCKVSGNVNPFIGASTSVGKAGIYHGLGKTFPGADTPFGMVQVSPNTITGGDNAPGYSYEHKTIEGFAFTQMSGVGWYGDMGNFLTMPTTGELVTFAGMESDPEFGGWRSEYDKKSEKASAGYYSALLSKYDIQAEATASQHSGILRFTFPENSQSRIQVDLARRIGGSASEEFAEVIGNNTLRGWIYCTPDGGGWGDGAGKVKYKLYFYAQFNRPFEEYGFWETSIPDTMSLHLKNIATRRYAEMQKDSKIIREKQSLKGKHIGFFSEFRTSKGEKIEMKVAFSYVDMAGAEKNFSHEIKNKTFNQIHKEAVNKWEDALSRITISGATKVQKAVFYTALYHTMIDPRIFSDVDGRFMGADGKIYKETSYNRRTVFSGWDVFRSQFPLQTIIDPKLVSDEVNTLIALADETGNKYFPRWELLNSYSGCMLGNPAISIITEAYLKGIRDYDTAKAYKYSVNTSNNTGNGAKGFTGGPLSISYTLEYAYTDWCIGMLAKEMGKTSDSATYFSKGQAYKNVFDPNVGWFRPRTASGEWMDWPEDAMHKEFYGCVECNPLQQGFFVPQDIDGLSKLIGGRKKTIDLLEDMFKKTPANMMWNQYYNHSNEPVHLIPYMFNRLGVPYLTQKWTRFICEHAYDDSVEGLVGNEDVGQMSAWYVLSASGLHPSTPALPYYEITSPLFKSAVFKLGNGKKFKISTTNNTKDNIYIQSATLNGKKYDECRISYSDIMNGGELLLIMGPDPSKWGQTTNQ